MIEIESYYAKTDQGPYLNINEDDIHVDLINRAFFIIDGFGGGTAGEMAVSIFKDKVVSFFNKVSGDPDSTMPHFFNSNYLLETNALINAFHIGHEAVLKLNENKDMNERGGLSCIGLILSEKMASIVSVGNCASFLYRASKVSVISAPDTLNPIGNLENNLNFKTFPTSTIGMYQYLNPKIWEISLKKEDKICLMSDGVYSQLSLEDIRSIIDTRKKDDQESVKKMFQLSSERGNLDNQSVIILSV